MCAAIAYCGEPDGWFFGLKYLVYTCTGSGVLRPARDSRGVPVRPPAFESTLVLSRVASLVTRAKNEKSQTVLHVY